MSQAVQTNEAAEPGINPRAEYAERLETRRAIVQRQARIHRGIADARLAVFSLGLVLVVLALSTGRISAAWALVPALVFFGLVIAYEWVGRVVRRAERSSAYYGAGVDRLRGHWAGRGESGLRFQREEHPYDLDLDLFGVGSVFERLCTARTPVGQTTLADWLLGPAPIETIRHRQAAAVELRDRIDLREEIALLGEDVREGIAPDALITWGKEPLVVSNPWPLRIAAMVLGLANVGVLIGWGFLGLGRIPLLAVFLISGGFAYALRGRVSQIVETIDRKADDLRLLAALLERIERERFETPRLLEIRQGMEQQGEPLSKQIGRLAHRVQLLEARRNQFFAPIGFALLWGTQFALAIEGWRQRFGPDIGRWLALVGEFEALCALSSYTFENPNDTFPELVAEGPLFEAEALGHPLIPVEKCVCNDVKLGGEDGPRVLLVSGSNMSGKSTLLRSVGVNTVLALAGGPVRARRLRVSPLDVGATLRVQDSLQAGKSRFYAEITRLRELVDLSQGERPLLFLLDEILHGTNSHDRRTGAEAIVRGLVDRGAIGLVTTHDLALAEIADQLAPRAVNVHFEDHLENGVMTFDYVMRPGVVRKSNALALMRAVGLEV